MTDKKAKPAPEVRKGQGDVKLTREQFDERLGERFYARRTVRCTRP